MVEARTIRCGNCNALIEITGLSPSVTCSYCGHVQEVDPALIDELRSYSEAVQDQVAEAEKERDHAAAWHKSTAQMGGKRMGLNYLMGFGLMAGLPMAVTMGAVMLIRMGHIPPEKTHYVSFLAMGSAMLGVVIYFAWYFVAGKKRKATRVGTTTVTCPSCGAPNMMQAGQVVETCLHCGAALMPDKSVQREVVSKARYEARRARLERYRAEREGMAAVQSYSMSGSLLVYFIGGSFLVPIGGIALVLSVQTIMGKEEFSPAIFGVWGMLLGAVAVMAVIIGRQKRRKRRLRSGLEALCARFSGRILGGLQGTVGWLNTHWAGPYDVHDMTKGTYGDSAELVVDGYPALVELDPIPAAKQIRPRALLLVACEIPGLDSEMESTLQLSPESKRLLDRLEAAGLSVQTQEGGLIARADAQLIGRIIGQDGAVAELGDMLLTMTRLANSLGTPGMPPE